MEVMVMRELSSEEMNTVSGGSLFDANPLILWQPGYVTPVGPYGGSIVVQAILRAMAAAYTAY